MFEPRESITPWHPPFAGMSADRADVLSRLIRDHAIHSILEIGSFCGDSAAWFSNQPGVWSVYCVDPMKVIQPWWEADVLAVGWPLNYGPCFYENITANGRADYIHLLQGTSAEMIQVAPVVDMVYVDGDHSYEGCLFDIHAYMPKARKLICGDDHHYDPSGNPYFPGVVQACEEALESYHVEQLTWWKEIKRG
jgi:hypothetical protein